MPASRSKARKKVAAKKKTATSRRTKVRKKTASSKKTKSRKKAASSRAAESRPAAPVESAPPERFPSVDVVDREKEIQVRAEVPGFDREDLSVTVTDRTLTIEGESRVEEEREEGDLRRREIRSGSFSRTLTLPGDVDGAKAKAKYKDGLLELTLPKRRRSKKHAIDVS